MTRCFVGILIPDEIKESILKIQKEIEKLPLKCKIVEKENLHVCFSFLGEVEDSKIKKIEEKLEEISKNYKKFEVFVDGLKPIPTENYIRVLVLDVIDKEGYLKPLMKEIVEKIGGDSKPAHLTLCRVKKVANKQMVKERIKKMELKVGSFVIDRIQLIKSELRKTGPIYTVLHECLLQ